MMAKLELATGWRLREDSNLSEDWIHVESLPSVVQIDLLRQGRIPDPFESLNELDVEWVGERSWIYQTSFTVPNLNASRHVDLVFDGLDTFADVRLNGETILESNNMFLQYRVDVAGKLLPGEENILELRFASALQRGRELVNQHSEHRFIGVNTELGRLAVRKAQYHWGWDWGPIIMTAGPWRPIRVELYECRIDDVHVRYDVADDLKSVQGTIVACTKGTSDAVRFELSLGAMTCVTLKGIVDDNGLARAHFSIDMPQLWFPHGYGEQPLYSVQAELLRDDSVMDTSITRVGFRKSELVRDLDAEGESFYFRTNNVDVFCGGACWIPADNMLPRLTDEDYRAWLTTMKECNQVMVRVWGGGIYENDIFYSVCDELGILVWQDFMFACGSYPTFSSFLENVKEEAHYNCRRLRNHPSVVLWAGNNEDYQIQERYNLDYQTSSDPEEWLRSSFPARYIYEHLLPKVVAEECPGVPYWPCSPFTGGGKDSGDLTIGDVHQWNVWHGTQEKYQKFPDLGGRFVSEFGMCSLPALATIHAITKDPKELYPQSVTLNFHNKADGGERRIATYLIENFRNATDLDSSIYLTQLLQAETLRYAYRDWRRQWGSNRRCGGALVWQLNDCWPCSSWAIVDYFHRRKPAFYVTRRQLQPVAVAVRREHRDWSISHARLQPALKYDVWVTSNRQEILYADVELRHISVVTGEDLQPIELKKNVAIHPNNTTELMGGLVSGGRSKPPCVLAVKLWVDGVCISRDADWPEPYKYLDLTDRSLSLSLVGETLTLSTGKPVKGFIVDAGDDVSLSDNCIDIMPGDDQKMQLSGYRGTVDELKWRVLY